MTYRGVPYSRARRRAPTPPITHSPSPASPSSRGPVRPTATRLGSAAIAEAVRRAHIPPERVDEVYMGIILAAGLGQAPARQASIYAGLPNTVPATTLNKMCGSGLKAVMLGAQAIQAGDAD